MGLLRRAAQGYLINRSIGGRQGRHGRSARYRTGWGSPDLARRRPSRRREGFGFSGPFPTYSRSTRRGTRVSVGGCCLPIPLALGLSGVAAARALTRR